MDHGAESQAVPPWLREVGHVDVMVPIRHPFAPLLQTFYLRCHGDCKTALQRLSHNTGPAVFTALSTRTDSEHRKFMPAMLVHCRWRTCRIYCPVSLLCAKFMPTIFSNWQSCSEIATSSLRLRHLEMNVYPLWLRAAIPLTLHFAISFSKHAVHISAGPRRLDTCGWNNTSSFSCKHDDVFAI